MAKYDSDITGWRTIFRNGNLYRIPIRESKKKDINEKLTEALIEKQQEMAQQSVYDYINIKMNIARLESDKYDDGTYDASTLAPKDYRNGYQVTYCQKGDNYTDEEHNALIRMFLRYTDDGVVSLGKFGGTPEHSFHVLSKAIAIRLAKKYNQKSVWDWKWYQKAVEYEAKYGEDDPRTIKAWAMCEINTGGTGERSK